MTWLNLFYFFIIPIEAATAAHFYQVHQYAWGVLIASQAILLAIDYLRVQVEQLIVKNKILGR